MKKIVNFGSAGDVVVYGRNTLERKKQDLEPFFQELVELVKNDELNKSADLYKKHPEVRIGLRRALLYLQKRGDIPREITIVGEEPTK